MTHPKWYLIDNQVPDFESKMTLAKCAVHHLIRREIGDWFEGKYLVQHMRIETFMPVNFDIFPPH